MATAYLGNNSIIDVEVGNNPVYQLYQGDNLLWQNDNCYNWTFRNTSFTLTNSIAYTPCGHVGTPNTTYYSLSPNTSATVCVEYPYVPVPQAFYMEANRIGELCSAVTTTTTTTAAPTTTTAAPTTTTEAPPTTTLAPTTTLPPQAAGYTYYTIASGLDASIPDWTIRIKNTITGSVGVFGWAIYCANAQYASPSASAQFGAALSSPVNTTRTTNGVTGSYGLPGWIKGFSSSSLFTDSFEFTGAGDYPWNASTCFYGGTLGNQTYISYIVRDRTKWTPTWSNWGNQPKPGFCAAYSCSFAATDITKYIDCATGTATTSSVANNACAREYQFSGAGGSPGKLTIKAFNTGSCGTY